MRRSRGINGGAAGVRGGRRVTTYLSFGAGGWTARAQCAWEGGQPVCLPRVVPSTREMRWYAVESFDGLVRSSFGVEEPP